MTVILQRMVRCSECDRPIEGQFFDQPADAAELPMPVALCDNCNLDVLPSPWPRQYDDDAEVPEDLYDDEAPEPHEEPRCPNCGGNHFVVRWDGYPNERVNLWVGDNYWCEECALYHIHVGMPQPILGRGALHDQGAQTHCDDCGVPVAVAWQW